MRGALEREKIKVTERTLAHPAENSLRWEDHIFLNHRILLYFSIDSGDKASEQPLFEKSPGARKDGPDWGKLVKSLRVEELSTRLLWQLEEAARQVITNCVAEDKFRCFLRSDVSAIARGDEYEFALVLSMTAALGG